MKATVNNFR
jgi:alpha-tubulin suppressor-like RCC1 family protein